MNSPRRQSPLHAIGTGLWLCLLIPYLTFCWVAITLTGLRQEAIDRKHGEGSDQ